MSQFPPSPSLKERISTAEVWREGRLEFWRRDKLSSFVVVECVDCMKQAMGICDNYSDRDDGAKRATIKLKHDHNCALVRAADEATL